MSTNYTQPGTNVLPAYAFNSEQSLGLYRSAASTVALSYGSLTAPLSSVSTMAITATAGTPLKVGTGGDGTTAYANLDGLRISGDDVSNTIYNANRDIFITRDSGGSVCLGQTVSGSFITGMMVNTTTGQSVVTGGKSILPPTAFMSELSLGWYRSAASVMALSYGGLGMKNGTNASFGTAVLGSNGSVNVATTYVAAGDVVFLTDQTAGGTLGDIELGGIRAGSGFTILSTSITDTSTVGWLIIRPS